MSIPYFPPEIVREILKFRRQIMYQEYLARNLQFHIEMHNSELQEDHSVTFFSVLSDLILCTNSLRHTLNTEFCTPVDVLTQHCKRLLETHVPGYSTKRSHVNNVKFKSLEHGKMKRRIIWGLSE
jgi:hypothetical protein